MDIHKRDEIYRNGKKLHIKELHYACSSQVSLGNTKSPGNVGQIQEICTEILHRIISIKNKQGLPFFAAVRRAALLQRKPTSTSTYRVALTVPWAVVNETHYITRNPSIYLQCN
jgi:hypothetical protein